MKRTRYRLELRTPCFESWEGMEPTPHGRFCQSNDPDYTLQIWVKGRVIAAETKVPVEGHGL